MLLVCKGLGAKRPGYERDVSPPWQACNLRVFLMFFDVFWDTQSKKSHPLVAHLPSCRDLTPTNRDTHDTQWKIEVLASFG